MINQEIFITPTHMMLDKYDVDQAVLQTELLVAVLNGYRPYVEVE